MTNKVGLTLLALAAAMPVSAQNTKPFTVQQITADHAVAALEAIPFLEADKTAIMARGEDGEKRRFFSFYDVSETTPALQIQMPDSALYFDFAHLNNAEQKALLFLDKDGVQTFDVAAGELQQLVKTSSIYKQNGSPLFTSMDFSQDFNGDGLADILIPNFDGYSLFLNDGTGQFSGALRLEMQVEMRLSGQTPRYSQFPVYSFDANFDGRTDVVFQQDNSFVAFLQAADGGFDTHPTSYQFDIDIVGNSFAAQVAQNDRYSDQTDLAETVIETIEDLNGDDIIDIVTQTDRARGVFDRSTTYAFHYGYESNGAIAFDKNPSTQILMDGITANPRHIDFAEDGRIDFAGGAVNIGIGKIIGILLSGSVGIPVMFYEQADDGTFSADPVFKKKISVDFDMSSGQSSVPVVEMTDIDGDGRKDLILSKDDDRIRVYKATPGKKKIFARKPIELTVALPKNGEQVSAADLNGDGKGDLMFHYDRLGADGESRKNQFVVLLAN